MPDSSDRLRATSIKAMNHVLFTLNSMHPETDIKNHPKFIVIFNDVSLYENVSLDKIDEYIKTMNEPENYNKFKGRKSQIERIEQYKKDLKAVCKKFYTKKTISDDTQFGSKSWKELKVHVCSSQDFLQEEWFMNLSSKEQSLVKILK